MNSFLNLPQLICSVVYGFGVATWLLIFVIRPADAGLVMAVSESGTGLSPHSAAVAAVPFGHEVWAYRDRNHLHVNARVNTVTGTLQTNLIGATDIALPAYLVGGEYIEIANGNKTISNYQLSVTVSAPVTAYLLLDNRLHGPNGNALNSSTTDPVLGGSLQWIVDDGWQRKTSGVFPNGQADYTGIREISPFGGVIPANRIAPSPGTDVHNFFSVYSKSFVAGTFFLGPQGIDNSNMYAIVIVPEPSSLALVGMGFTILCSMGLVTVSTRFYFRCRLPYDRFRSTTAGIV